MASPILTQGPGNLVPFTETRVYLANGTVTKGDVVGLTGITGYTVDQATATISAIGVAAETGTDVWIEVVIAGFCDFVTNDGTDVVALDFLHGLAGKAVPKTAIELAVDVTVGDLSNVFGQSLEAETGTTCTAVNIIRRV